MIDPNSLRSSNTVINVDTSLYDSSIGYLLPLWQDRFGNKLSKIANLGTIRAGRDQIIPLHVYDPYPYVGPVTWDWSTTVNPDIKIVTDNHFNLIANKQGSYQIAFKDTPILPSKGMQVKLSDYINGYDDTTYNITSVFQFGENAGYFYIDQPLPINTLTIDGNLPDSTVMYVGTPSEHPIGLNLDPINGELYGIIPYQPAYTRTYRFTIKITKSDLQSGETISSFQIFLLSVKGDITSYLQFITTGSLGTLVPGQDSELSVLAKNINSTYSIEYTLVNGQLPIGLTLGIDGSIQGSIEYGTNTSFDFTSTNNSQSFTIDGGNTTVDKNWYFTVQANDVYKTSSVNQLLSIEVDFSSAIEYTKIYVKPFLSIANREIYKEFITNDTTFDPSLIYRISDPAFGIQKSIKMIIETGIQKVSINNYVSAIQQLFYRKKFYFGDIKSTIAQDSSGNSVYELIYVEIIDNQMIGNYSPSYATSVGNMQFQLESIPLSSNTTISLDQRLQPRYMTTIQPSTGIPLGFIKAVPICYVLPGNSAKILTRIKSTGFDFKQFNFDTDRIIIQNSLETNDSNWVLYTTTNV